MESWAYKNELASEQLKFQKCYQKCTYMLAKTLNSSLQNQNDFTCVAYGEMDNGSSRCCSVFFKAQSWGKYFAIYTIPHGRINQSHRLP